MTHVPKDPLRKSTWMARSRIPALLIALATPPGGAAVAEEGMTSALGQAVVRESEATVKAFNAADATALAAMFYESGELIDESGTVHAGRPAITGLFTRFFERHPQAELDLAVTEVRPVGEAMAVEEGLRRITTPAGDAAEVRYTAVRTKQGDRWPIASYREFAADPLPTPHEALEALAWIEGDWVDEGPQGRTAISFRWSDDGNFLIGEYTMSVAGEQEPDFELTIARKPPQPGASK